MRIIATSFYPFRVYCEQHGQAELLAVSVFDEASSIMAAGRLHMTHTMKDILRMAGDLKSASSIPSHFYV